LFLLPGRKETSHLTNLIVIENANLTFSSGEAVVAAKANYTLMSVIAYDRGESTYSPIGISEQTGGGYKVKNAQSSLTAGLKCRLLWIKSF
jgi:hypothetical protein